jgi:sugar phosphate permease
MVLFLLCLMYLLTYIDRVNVSMASAVFDKELKLDKTQVGFIFSAFAYPYLVFQILGGYFGDHFGPRKVLTICSLIWVSARVRPQPLRCRAGRSRLIAPLPKVSRTRLPASSTR